MGNKWDIRFMRVAKEISTWSKCMSRKIGAVIVRDKLIIGTGFNGAPRGVKECNERTMEFYDKLYFKEESERCMLEGKNEYPLECPRKDYGFKSGEGLFMCQAGHAERNALIQCARNGISTKGATLYCYCGQICKDCAIEIINAGISKLVYLDGQPDYDKYSGVLLKESEIEIVKINPKEL